MSETLLFDLENIISNWLKEDIPSFDIGGYVVGQEQKEAFIYQKNTGILTAIPFVNMVFKLLDCSIEWLFKEGSLITVTDKQRIIVAKVHGKVFNLLQGERLALNIMARASGIATRASKLIQLKQSKNWKGVIAGTRKTTPGFRIVEKYSMIIGGADTHRMDLSSMVMLKDNHIWSHGSITKAVQRAKTIAGFSLKIEVECQSYEEALEAINAGADIVMLDNFTPASIQSSSDLLKKQFPHVIIEASGGLTEDNAVDYMFDSVDVLSFGCLSQSVQHVDFSMKVSH